MVDTMPLSLGIFAVVTIFAVFAYIKRESLAKLQAWMWILVALQAFGLVASVVFSSTMTSLIAMLVFGESLILLFLITIGVSKLEQVEEIKTELLSMATHQLRTPLGSMRWNIEMLLGGEKGSISSEVKQAIDEMKAVNGRMTKLVSEFLNISRIDQGHLAGNQMETDIVELVRKAAKEVQPEANSKSVQINLNIEPGIPQLMLDPERFYYVIENIFSNAVKYNKKGGKVNIRITRADGQVLIKISDTGIGIPERDRKKLFNRYFRANNAIKGGVKGSGLGLFIANSYVRACGGRIEVESKENEGSTFTVSLPLKLASEPEGSSKIADSEFNKN